MLHGTNQLDDINMATLHWRWPLPLPKHGVDGRGLRIVSGGHGLGIGGPCSCCHWLIAAQELGSDGCITD